MTYEVEWIRPDGTSGVYDCGKDDKEFLTEIKACIENGYEVIAKAKK